jgi:aminoglycoside 6'-N-acetyltransferase I
VTRNPPNLRIVDFPPDAEPLIQQAAALLVEAFKENWPDAWPDLATATEEVRESFAPGRISRVAVDDQGTVLGWIGGIPGYGGRVWELHPLVVRPTHQGRGIGRALVADLEERVKERGGLTLWVGTDDENNLTSLGGVDLYPDVLIHLANLRNLRNHPFGFYQKLGFAVVGVVPDANGWGKPDILMAKRVGERR